MTDAKIWTAPEGYWMSARTAFPAASREVVESFRLWNETPSQDATGRIVAALRQFDLIDNPQRLPFDELAELRVATDGADEMQETEKFYLAHGGLRRAFLAIVSHLRLEPIVGSEPNDSRGRRCDDDGLQAVVTHVNRFTIASRVFLSMLESKETSGDSLAEQAMSTDDSKLEGIPCWNSQKGMLTLGTDRAEMFNNRTPAGQGTILAAFEAVGWPSLIPSPFQKEEWDDLRNSIYELNVRLLKHGIPLRFISKKRPEQSISWERTQAS